MTKDIDIKPAQLEPLEFVKINGMGKDPVICQVTFDGTLALLSTKHVLSPIIPINEIIHSNLGSMSKIIDRNRVVFQALLKKILAQAEHSDGNVTDDDPLLNIRAFLYLLENFSDEDALIEANIELAIQNAIATEKMVLSLHTQLAEIISDKEGR